MKNWNRKSGRVVASIAIGLVTFAGCSSGNSGNPYPTGHPMSDPAPMTPAPLMVPAGAITKAEAVYGLISFSLDGPGLLYITDETTNTVIAGTSPAADMIGRSLSMADLRNVTHQLDTTHRYLISFVPQHMIAPSTMPTTAP